MTSKIRSTKTPGFQDSHEQGFPTFLDKKTQNQPKAKANPQHKILNNQKYTENLRDHGDSYQTGHLNSDMSIERLGSRNVNQTASADGCFSVDDLMRRFGKVKNLQQEVQKKERQDSPRAIARKRLEEFSLESLNLTKTNKFDGRLKETKEYLNLCASADVDPYEYYEENLHKQPQSAQNHHEEEEEEEKEEEEQVINQSNKDAWAQLKDFPLGSLKITKKNTFDMRNGISKEFIALCESAGVDPMQYYFEYHDGQDNSAESEETLVESVHNYQPASNDKTNKIKEPVSSEKSNKIKQPVYQNHQYEQEEGYDSDKEAALAKLREFPLNELWLTKKNTLDMRKNNTKDYLLLCHSAGVDAMDYYFENIGNPSNVNFTNGESGTASIMSKKSTESQKSAGSVKSSLTLTKDNKLDKRCNSSKDFIKEKIAEAELRLSQFDTSQLKTRSNGELDKRYKVNKEYIELQEQTQESYWQNVKFNE